MQKWGVSFNEAHNGKQAVELAIKNPYDLIFMDIRMPVMDGYEATKIILQLCPSVKIMGLTANASPSDIQKLQMAGMQAFVQKPFAESDLLSTVNKLLAEKTEAVSRESIVKNTTIDLDELERLSGGDTAFFDEMLQIFIRSSEDALTKLHQNFQTSSWTVLSETAHKLAAPAKHIQAHSLYANLKKLEFSSENSNPLEIKKLIVEIENDICHINSILKEKLKRS